MVDHLTHTGIVFDVLRSSMHDGPGIRTTVFLKGCTLNCVWCHNPEANAFKPQLFFYAERCQLCGSCEAVCPSDVHHIINGEHIIDFNKCKTCGLCVLACDQKALKIIGTDMTVEMVMDQVLSDRSFYEKSGGGVTLSGGEPLAQIDFAYDLLHAAKEQGIHTCLETSCFSSQKNLERIMPVVDLFLIDYKATGSAVHQHFTGVDNDQIVSNMDFVYAQGKPIILRCPIIPGINDTDIHFKGIACLDQKYPDLKGIELLPYHDFGNNKRTSTGGAPTLTGIKTTSPELAAKWLLQLSELGCQKAHIG